MKQNRLRWVVAAVATMISLAGCGGGGGNAGTSPFEGSTSSDANSPSSNSAVVGSVKLTLSLSSPTVTSAVPATVKVLLTDASTGTALPSKIVQFATANQLGAFSAASALTGADGVATVTLSPAVGASSGADEVIVSTTINGTTVTQREGFQLTSSSVSVSSLSTALGETNALSAYGQTNVSVELAGVSSGTPVEVSLMSTCISKGKAEISPSKVTSTNGRVSAVYKDKGCGATDSVDSIQAVVTGSNASKTTSVKLTSPTVNSITFSQATPSTIYLKGSGLTESSTVMFQVVDTQNNPLQGQQVDLTLTTTAGGVTMDQGTTTVTKTSDADGKVSVQINSGTVPTPVRVLAKLTGSNVSTVSSGLTVAVGLPSEQNFSLAQTTINIEGFSIDGTANKYTIIASDRSGNPVPVQTAINFVTEGGQIESSKQIDIGADGIARTTANFVSAGARPDDGRITITAYALGEESFLDKNGNNVWDAGEPFQDLGDVYKDRLFDAVFDQNVDEYISLGISSTGQCVDSGTSLLPSSAKIPTRPGTCDGVWGRAYVRAAVETVLSTSTSSLLWQWAGAPGNVLDDGCSIRMLQYSSAANQAKFYNVQGTRWYGLDAQGVLDVIAADSNAVRLNPMPASTKISATATEGITVSVQGGTPVPNTSEATGFGIGYKFTEATSGSVTVTTESPSGLKSSTSFFISQDARPLTSPACTK